MGQPKGPAVAELVILGHWGHLRQVRGRNQLPYAHVLKVSSPSLVVRGGAVSPEYKSKFSCEGQGCSLAAVSSERHGQFSQGQRQVDLAQHVPLISSHMVPKAPEVTRAADINTEPSCSWTMDSRHGLGQQLGPG